MIEIRQGERTIEIIKTLISFIVDEKGVAEEVTVTHHLERFKGVIISQKVIITPKGAPIPVAPIGTTTK